MSTTVDHGRFSLDDYADELKAAPDNTQIGHEIWFENDRVRIWGINLAPGQRVPLGERRAAEPRISSKRRSTFAGTVTMLAADIVVSSENQVRALQEAMGSMFS